MKSEEYIKIQCELIALAAEVKKLSLGEFLKAISRAEAAGPILDPTMYREAYENLRAIKCLAECFMDVQIAADQLQESVVKTAIRRMGPTTEPCGEI